MFHFKQFSIDDSMSTMKVGTDALLLGSTVDVEHAQSILEIGTGSGVIALMLAQRCTARIDAIEINQVSAAQALMNVNLSPWPHRIRVTAAPLQDYLRTCSRKYDLIVCNPPFFRNSLKCENAARNMARHNDLLPVEVLMNGIRQLLDEKGKGAVIIPSADTDLYRKSGLEAGLYPAKVLNIITREGKPPSRAILSFTLQPALPVTSALTINSPGGQYTEEYKKIAGEFLTIF